MKHLLEVIKVNIYQFKGNKPVIDPTTYVFPSATLIGDVVIGKNCFIGPGAVLRGDKNKITIGNETFIHDLVVIHTEEEFPTTIGNKVQIGAGSILHCENIEDNVSIGLSVVLGMGSKIKSGTVVTDGSLVPQGKEVSERLIVAGIPAKPIEEFHELWIDPEQIISQLHLRETYRNHLELIL